MRTTGMSGGLGRVGESVQKQPGRAAAVVLGAVLAGIYLGSSTVAEINPFYRHAPVETGSSYTSDGWRGADAVSPPASPAPTENRASRFMSGIYAWAPAGVRDFAAKVSEARDLATDVAAVGQEVGEYARSLDGSTEALVPAAPPADLARPTSHDNAPLADGAEDCGSADDPCPADPPLRDDDRPSFEDDYPAYDGPVT